MKKPVNALVALTCIFAAFMGGFHIGRRLNRAPVYLYQTLPETPPTSASEPEAEASAAEMTEQTEPEALLPLNINTATASELDQLPGIGPALAQRIVDYRTIHGSFQAVEELVKVNGIGESRLMDLLDLITVEEVRK